MNKPIVILLFVFSLFVWSCKKSQEPAPAEQKAPTSVQKSETESPQAEKGTKKKQKKPKQKQAVAKKLELYLNDEMVLALASEDLSPMMSASIQVQEKEVKAVPLLDLLTQNKMNGKKVIVSGSKNTCTLDRNKISEQDLFLYLGEKNKVQLFQKNPKEGTRCPGSPLRITVTDQETTQQAAAKPKKKRNKT